MWHKNHIFRKALVPFSVVASFLGAGGALPAAADDGSALSRSAASRSLPDSRSVPDARYATDPWSAVEDWSPADAWSATGHGPGHRRPYVTGDPRAQGARIYKGQAFDACIAPRASTMRAWKASPFRAVGVYIGGRARACPNQPNLNTGWVQNVHGMGWELLPIYVGSQSPCVSSQHKRRYAMGHSRPAQRGASEGRDAVKQAKALGMKAHSAIYLDMEAYNNRSTKCAATTLRFVQGWNRAVKKAGYLPGFYSSAGSGIEHMEGARKAGRKDLPEVLWFARWTGRPSVNRERSIDDRAWQPHRRIHQYNGNVRRTYGGHRLNIDRNMMDAPVAIVR